MKRLVGILMVGGTLALLGCQDQQPVAEPESPDVEMEPGATETTPEGTAAQKPEGLDPATAQEVQKAAQKAEETAEQASDAAAEAAEAAEQAQEAVTKAKAGQQ